MNLGELKARVYRTFGDEAQVQITDADLLRWANDGQRDICMQNETLLQTSKLTQAVNGQQEYDLPTDMMVLRSLHYKRNNDVTYYKMRSLTMQEFDEWIDGWDGTLYQSGWPQVYMKYGSKLSFFPIPDESGADTGTQNIKMYYSRKPVDLVNDSDPIDLPTEYHNALVEAVLYQSYVQDEDWSAAQQVAQKMATDIKTLRNRENEGGVEFYPRITVYFDDEW